MGSLLLRKQFGLETMWKFEFTVDYRMIDTRIVTKRHEMTANDPEISSEEQAWDWVKDQFKYEDYEFIDTITVRKLETLIV